MTTVHAIQSLHVNEIKILNNLIRIFLCSCKNILFF